MSKMCRIFFYLFCDIKNCNAFPDHVKARGIVYEIYSSLVKVIHVNLKIKLKYEIKKHLMSKLMSMSDADFISYYIAFYMNFLSSDS